MASFTGRLVNLGVSLPASAAITYSFGTASQSFDTLVAKSWCDGKRIDLLWENPSGTTQVRIRRSGFSFCRFVTDPGVDVYAGPPITVFVDGPGPVPASYGPYVQSSTPLAENSFYYYTVFYSLSPTAPYTWVWALSGEVEGLSIRDYYAAYGDYIYGLIPRTYRDRDADPVRGSDQYKLRDYMKVIQCAINIYRGWLEGLLKLGDPDTMPAGRLGVASNQTGILQARSWDLGMPPEKSFDAGVLRRIAQGIVAVYRQKGTCDGLIALTKLFTTWDATCSEAIEPTCGMQNPFTTWDGVSKINTVVAANDAANPALGTGNITVQTATIFTANGVTADALPNSAQSLPTVTGVIDAMGTFACVTSVGVASGGNQVLTFFNTAAKLRSAITGTGTGVAGQFSINSIDSSAYPWQFPGGPAPGFGWNAWVGYKLKDSASNIFAITASAPTVAGVTLLTVSGTPVSGAFTLAAAFDGTTKAPLFQAKLYTGSFSLLFDPKWDAHLVGFVGPWSLLTGLGSISALNAPTPADVTVYVSNVANLISTVTSITHNSLTDSIQAWPSNQWAGYYVVPNWNASRAFRIVSNTNNILTVDISTGGGVDSVALAGTTYVILTEENALKYSRLSALLPSFVPIETRTFVKFD